MKVQEIITESLAYIDLQEIKSHRLEYQVLIGQANSITHLLSIKFTAVA